LQPVKHRLTIHQGRLNWGLSRYNLCGSLDFPAQPDGDAAQVSACSEATIDRPTRRVTKKKPPASAGGPVHALGIFATPYLPAAYSGMASS
jgi:hypothetical protein